MREPEWTAENINRKKGDTTFKQCGWCKHASCGSVRYGCYLDTSCSLLSDYGVGKEVKWNTPCIVMKLGKQDLLNAISSKKCDIRSAERSIKYRQDEIAEIKKLKLPNRPPLPDSRVEEFKLGSVVYVFYEMRWNRGTVVPGYRSGDGCVSYVLDDYPESKKGWGCGSAVPCVLKEWEYKYFKKNLGDFREWLNFSDREYNGEKLSLDDYYTALERTN